MAALIELVRKIGIPLQRSIFGAELVEPGKATDKGGPRNVLCRPDDLTHPLLKHL